MTDIVTVHKTYMLSYLCTLHRLRYLWDFFFHGGTLSSFIKGYVSKWGWIKFKLIFFEYFLLRPGILCHNLFAGLKLLWNLLFFPQLCDHAEQYRWRSNWTINSQKIVDDGIHYLWSYFVYYYIVFLILKLLSISQWMHLTTEHNTPFVLSLGSSSAQMSYVVKVHIFTHWN